MPETATFSCDPRHIAGVNDRAEKLFTGVNDKFFGGVNDTSEFSKNSKRYRWHTQGPGGHIYEKNLKSKSRVRLSLKNTDTRNRIRKNGSATLGTGTDTLKIFHESLSCFACIMCNFVITLNNTYRTLCSYMFCYFISDTKVTGIRMPEAAGIDLTQAEWNSWVGSITSTTHHNIHRYKNTEARQTNVPTERQTDRQNNRL